MHMSSLETHRRPTTSHICTCTYVHVMPHMCMSCMCGLCRHVMYVHSAYTCAYVVSRVAVACRAGAGGWGATTLGYELRRVFLSHAILHSSNIRYGAFARMVKAIRYKLLGASATARGRTTTIGFPRPRPPPSQRKEFLF